MRFGLGSIVGRVSVVVLVAATVVAVASPSSADAGDPIGAFDAAQIHLPYYAPNEWNLYGWAADPDAPGAQVTVHLYVDGVGVTNSYPTPPHLDGAYPVATGDPRPDVAAAFPFAGQNSGWKTQLTLPDTGEHTVCAYALNVGAGSQNTSLGCITLTPNAPGNPIGNLDALTPAQGLIRFQGWAGDPNPNPDPFPLRVRVYEDGLQAYSFPADLPRPDAQNAFPALAGVGGFDFTAP